MPVPSDLTIFGFRVEGLSEVHASRFCATLDDVTSPVCPVELPLLEYDEGTGCALCGVQQLPVAAAYRSLLTDGVPPELGGPDDVVVLEKRLSALSAPPIVRELLQQHSGGAPVRAATAAQHPRFGLSKPVLVEVPAWLAHFAACSEREEVTARHLPFQALAGSGPGLPVVDVEFATELWRLTLQAGGEYASFHAAMVDARDLLEQLGMEVASTALQLWSESLEVKGPLRSLSDALGALELLMS